MTLQQLNLKVPPEVLSTWKNEAARAGYGDSVRDYLVGCFSDHDNMSTKPTSRIRSQLAIQAPPELLESVRIFAADQKRTVTSLVLQWIENGLSGNALPLSAEVPRQSWPSRYPTTVEVRNGWIYTICDDGTIWRASESAPDAWHALPGVPQP